DVGVFLPRVFCDSSADEDASLIGHLRQRRERHRHVVWRGRKALHGVREHLFLLRRRFLGDAYPALGNWPLGQAARVYLDKILVGSNSGGLRVSTDGGSTWTPGTGGFSVTCVHKDPATGYLFAGTPLGLYGARTVA
ncbi:MAG: hypothetical protein QME13_03390, partial [Thermoanaerobacteraceae bacterium]|nr:hypothetical protein [Thermoanaerobacteraceae bacterium]